MGRFYVYSHVCPKNGETVYIGKGVGGRAWDVTRCRGEHKVHQVWMESLLDEGFLPEDWVVILHKNLEEKEAFRRELEEIHTAYPLRFNRQVGESQHQAILTNDEAKELFRLSWSGEFTRKELSDLFGVCESNVSMIKHKKQWKSILKEETNENYERNKAKTR